MLQCFPDYSGRLGLKGCSVAPALALPFGKSMADGTSCIIGKIRAPQLKVETSCLKADGTRGSVGGRDTQKAQVFKQNCQ